MFKRTPASLILLGIAWPGVTVCALVVKLVGGQQRQFAQRPSTLWTAT